MASPTPQQGKGPDAAAGCSPGSADAAAAAPAAVSGPSLENSQVANTGSAAQHHPADQSKEGGAGAGHHHHPQGAMQQEEHHASPPRDKEEGELEEQMEPQQQHGDEHKGQVEGRRDGGGSSDAGERDKGKREGKSKRSKEDKKASKERDEERRARKEEKRARREAEGKSSHKKHKSAAKDREGAEVDVDPEARGALAAASGREQHKQGPAAPLKRAVPLLTDMLGPDEERRGGGIGRREADKRALLEEEEWEEYRDTEHGGEGGSHAGKQGSGRERVERHRHAEGRGVEEVHTEEDRLDGGRRGDTRRQSGRSREDDEQERHGSRRREWGADRDGEWTAAVDERVESGRAAGGSAREEGRREERAREDSRQRGGSKHGRRDAEGGEDRSRRRGDEGERYGRGHHRDDKYGRHPREEEHGRHRHRGEEGQEPRERERRERDRERERRERDRSRERGRERGQERERDRERREREREGERRGRGREREEAREHQEHRDGRHRSSKRQRSEEEEEVALQGETEEDEQAAIEARRNRIAALKAKHQQQAGIINPTATALQQDVSVSVPVTGQQEPSGVAGTAQQAASGSAAVSAGTATVEQAQREQLASSAAAGMDVDGEAEDTAPRPNLREGTATPEGDRTSSEEPEGGLRPGPMLQIWGNNEASNLGAVDEADSGAPAGFGKAGARGPATSGAGGAASSGGIALTEENAGKATAQERIQATAATTAKHKLVEADDMFAEQLSGDDDDMFAERPERGDEGERERDGGAPLRQGAGGGALQDAYDDHEGYYNFQVGEIMDKRYEVFACHGKGVFSIVVRARDISKKDEAGQHPEVAIKLIRANETMYKAAQMELAVLHRLGQADQENRKHCIRLLRYFEYRNHMCLVFEPMAFNLRELTKKYGRNKGLNLEAVQLFSCQLLIALRHLKKNEVLHADIKPDNILINQRHNKVKLCDFGSAMMAGENDVTPYLVSRFYRPPEVILGMKYDYALDMWSVGSVIYELFTGRILFPGHSNNQMLKLMMDVKGGFTKKMLRKCLFAEKHFEMHDPSCPFISLEDDPITKTKVRKLITTPTVKHNFTALLSHCSGDKAKVAMLADLLEKMMMLEPERRIDPDAALRHPFVKAFLPKRDSQHGGKRQ